MKPSEYSNVLSVEKENILLCTLRWFIAMFFIASPLNPSFNDMTIYLWIPLVFLDVYFLNILGKVNKNFLIIMLVWFSYCVLVNRIDIAIKSFVLLLGVVYLTKIKDRILDKLYVWMLISISWCILQFVLYQINPSLSSMIGPSEISRTLWGEYATATYSNQYELFFLPRMSGLSREAGFFVSLLVVMFLTRVRYKVVTKKEKILFFLGYVFSISKVSFVAIILFFIQRLKRYLSKIPLVVFIFIFFSLFLFLAHYLDVGVSPFFYLNESIAHRLSSSYLISDMKIPNLIYGCDSNYSCFQNNQPMLNYLSNIDSKT
nr:hypothetical protein PJ912_21310 [Pectobacterium colocasium]